jgi:hypothetical protein
VFRVGLIPKLIALVAAVLTGDASTLGCAFGAPGSQPAKQLPLNGPAAPSPGGQDSDGGSPSEERSENSTKEATPAAKGGRRVASLSAAGALPAPNRMAGHGRPVREEDHFQPSDPSRVIRFCRFTE